MPTLTLVGLENEIKGNKLNSDADSGCLFCLGDFAALNSVELKSHCEKPGYFVRAV